MVEEQVEEVVEEVAAVSTDPDGEVVVGSSAEMEDVIMEVAGAEPGVLSTSTSFPNLHFSSGAPSPIPLIKLWMISVISQTIMM